MLKKLASLTLGLALAGLIIMPARADEPALRRQLDQMRTEPRVALVIGSAAYESFPNPRWVYDGTDENIRPSLASPVNDAHLMTETLRSLGFDVIELTDEGYRIMDFGVNQLKARIKKGGVALFYYSGHAAQSDGENYLLPMGAGPGMDTGGYYDAVALDAVFRAMEKGGARLNIVILDASRSNSIAGPGLAPVEAPRGMIIAFAAGPGKVTGDEQRELGIFTEQLVRAISGGERPIEDVFEQARSAVIEQTGGAQVPWVSSYLTGDFYFKVPDGDALAAELAAAASKVDGRLHVMLNDGMSSEMPFTGFNARCDGYGDAGIRHLDVTIPWTDVKYLLPQVGVTVLNSGRLITTEALRARSCPKAWAGDGEGSVSMLDAAVVAFSAEGLAEGRAWYIDELLAEAARELRVRRYYEAEAVYRKALLIDPANADARAGIEEALRTGFRDNGDGTVTGRDGLVWQQRDDGQGRGWKSAVAYCEALVLGGRTHWRLPTSQELSTLQDLTQRDAAINPRMFPGAAPGRYWTSKLHSFSTDYAGCVDFDNREDYDNWGNETCRKKFREHVRCVNSVGEEPVASASAPAAADNGPSLTRQQHLDALTAQMVLVKGGCFQMGREGGDEYESPEREVCLSDYYIGKYEVTQAQWAAVMGHNPSRFADCDECPVEMIFTSDVDMFLRKLNKETGQVFRLPTDAEWEYAARSGGRDEPWAGTSDVSELGQYAWLEENSGSDPHPVGLKKPNGLGLHDMTGNVREWVRYAPILRRQTPILSDQIRRGGSWNDSPEYARSTRPCFGWDGWGGEDPATGFRLVRTP